MYDYCPVVCQLCDHRQCDRLSFFDEWESKEEWCELAMVQGLGVEGCSSLGVAAITVEMYGSTPIQEAFDGSTAIEAEWDAMSRDGGTEDATKGRGCTSCGRMWIRLGTRLH